VRKLGATLAITGFLFAAPAAATPFFFTTGAPDGRIATASRPGTTTEIESADDFILSQSTLINHATFTGLLPAGAPLSTVSGVTVEIYRVFPFDSVTPPSGRVPTRTNSPSDNAFDSHDSASAQLTFTETLLNPNFTTANSVLNGINPIPNQTTGGEGSVTGEEVRFDVSFTSPFLLPADHYFFVPQVQLSSGNFYWLSTARPGPVFVGDLQSWIRNTNLDPDWLRIGTDIVGGTNPPTYNAAFSLDGQTVPSVPEPGTLGLLGLGIAGLGFSRRRKSN
jgi:PEP-CTERM motif